MIQLAGAKLDSADTGLCVGEIIVALFAALALVCNPAKWGLHCLSILLLLPLVFSMVRINRRHNEFISRPVPFFGEEGEK
jgi:peptidoglycan/LPS O-acetylase OafA/YrhL